MQPKDPQGPRPPTYMERAMTVREVAAEYGVQPDTVYAWIKAKLLRPIRLPGGDYRIRREHLAEFDEQHRVREEPKPSITSDSAETTGFGRSRGMRGRDPFLLGQQSAERQRKTRPRED